MDFFRFLAAESLKRAKNGVIGTIFHKKGHFEKLAAQHASRDAAIFILFGVSDDKIQKRPSKI